MSDPFDISKALEGAVAERLSPNVSRFKIHSEYGPAGDQENAIGRNELKNKLKFEDLEINSKPKKIDKNRMKLK